MQIVIITDPQIPFPAVTVCNTNKVRRSQILFSKHREVLFIDDQQPLPYYGKILYSELGSDIDTNTHTDKDTHTYIIQVFYNNKSTAR